MNSFGWKTFLVAMICLPFLVGFVATVFQCGVEMDCGYACSVCVSMYMIFSLYYTRKASS